MSSELEPLDDELQRLLEAEANFPSEPRELQKSVWRRVHASIPPTSSGGGSPAASPVASASVGSKIGAITLSAFVAGGVTGALVHRALVEPIIVEVPAPAEPAEPPASQPTIAHAADGPILATQDASVASPTEPLAAQQPERPERAARRSDSPVEPRGSGHPSTESTLAQERAIIDVARTAIARGHPNSALAAIERHAREFPRGQLTEEREGLRIIALVRSGRVAEAESLSERFRQRYPRSLLLAAIDSALRANE